MASASTRSRAATIASSPRRMRTRLRWSTGSGTGTSSSPIAARRSRPQMVSTSRLSSRDTKLGWKVGHSHAPRWGTGIRQPRHLTMRPSTSDIIGADHALGHAAAHQQDDPGRYRAMAGSTMRAAQHACSCGVGSRLFKGRQFTEFVLTASRSRSIPIPARVARSSLPVLPCQGRPTLSSTSPGASPIIIRPRRNSPWGGILGEMAPLYNPHETQLRVRPGDCRVSAVPMSNRGRTGNSQVLRPTAQDQQGTDIDPPAPAVIVTPSPSSSPFSESTLAETPGVRANSGLADLDRTRAPSP